MELPHIGQTCFICRRNDYLPFECNHCHKIVCIDHRNNHGNDCPLNATHFDSEAQSTSSNINDLKKKCDYCHKITLKLELTSCDGCHSEFCLYHRHQAQHDCSQLVEGQATKKREKDEKYLRQKMALDRLKEKVQPTHNSPVKPQTSLRPKNQALARRVRLMTIKQFAKGPPNILVEDRIYFEVKFLHNEDCKLSDKSKDGSSIRIFTSPKHTIGRMIDWAAEELKVVNKNHIIGASQLVFQVRDDSGSITSIDSQKPFSEFLDSSQIVNGDEIILAYVDSE